MATPNPPQVLCNEILAEAGRERERILQLARQEAEQLLAKARTEAERNRQQKLAGARAEASRRREQILASVPLEAARLRLAKVENLLQSVYQEIRRRLQMAAGENVGYRETLSTLAIEALCQMSGNTFVVKLSPADYTTFGRDVNSEMKARLGQSSQVNITLAADPTLSEPGVVIEDVEGHQVWDNRLSARLERMWPELRRQIAFTTGLVSENELAGEASKALTKGAGTACPREFFPAEPGTSCPRPEQQNVLQSQGGTTP